MSVSDSLAANFEHFEPCMERVCFTVIIIVVIVDVVTPKPRNFTYL